MEHRSISELQIGKAGEYLVCAELILKGFIAFPSEQGLRYDVVVDIEGKLIRIQVKTTREYRFRPQRKTQISSYLFHPKRCGKGGMKCYTEMDIDIMAFVAIKDSVIGYLPVNAISKTMMFRSRKCEYVGNRPGIYLEDCTFEKALKTIRGEENGSHTKTSKKID
ncbi:hypothetical protein UFOVP264_41 [uncultured Caudovirales phage]|uniref:PD(D/E)XK endonuclease domain-containing protein n=1 Tax=uncultured Caudovirales phage TaxID=2100421 RepID=A0A6J5LGN9_9CAUD|nr:hypothetical protein UFOVP264_41 [uncultured Caudovirales phage]